MDGIKDTDGEAVSSVGDEDGEIDKEGCTEGMVVGSQVAFKIL